MHWLLLASGFTEVRPGLIFWTLITFGVVAIVLRWQAWGPILKLVEEREKQIANAIESAKRERAEAEKMLADQKTAIAEARREAAEMMRKSQQDMEVFRTNMMAEAKKQAEEEKTNAKRMIQEEKAKAIAEVRELAVSLAIDITKKLIGEEMDEKKHRLLAEQFIRDLPKPGAIA